MGDPEREPANFSAALRAGKRKYGFDLHGAAARALMSVMVLCTFLVGAEVLAGIAWLIAQAV